ncbi:MAG TPA: hypothetical protein VN861_16960 [Candidatus Acidoferrales bacterium]|nr:hypothetical protein [Candidatus Acidoferrales bacterium]
MTDTVDITRWIPLLADRDPQNRADAATRLYLAGSSMCTPLLKQWLGEPDFRALILPSEQKTPPGRSVLGPASIVVGIAVQPETFEKIRAANYFAPLADVPPDQDAREFELHFETHVELDILTTRQPGGQGAIARYLEKFGEGIQQIEVYVGDVGRATDILRSRFGLQPIYPATRAGANGTRINFFLAPAQEGKKVLIELVEAKAPNT